MHSLLLLIAWTSCFAAQEEQVAEPARQTRRDLLARSVVKVSMLVPTPMGLWNGEGSGFFVSPTRVVTNYHVIRGCDRAQVLTVSGDAHRVTRVLAWDRTWDLALLEVDIPDDRAHVLALADSPPRPGALVRIASQGFLDEEYEREEGEERSFFVQRGGVIGLVPFGDFGELLHTSVPFYEGQSGSPILGCNREVVGVAAMYTYMESGSYETYAIPVSRVRELLSSAESQACKPEAVPRFYRNRLTDLDAFVDVVRTYNDMGIPGQGLQLFQTYLEKLDPEQQEKLAPEAWIEAADCALQEGLSSMEEGDQLADGPEADVLRTALAWFERATTTAPQTVFDCLVKYPARFNVGFVHFLLGQNLLARRQLKEVLRDNAWDADAHFYLALIGHRLGNDRFARRHTKELRRLVGRRHPMVQELLVEKGAEPGDAGEGEPAEPPAADGSGDGS